MKNMKSTNGSSIIESYGYDETEEKLYIKMNHGKVYCYEGIGKALYNEFDKAESKGIHYNAHIKGQFDYYDVTELYA